MEMSENINELAAALAKAQAELNNAKKSSNNPYFKSKYADLAEVLDTCREVLSKNGLSVIQPVGAVSEQTIEVTTVLMHSSGQWVKSKTNMPMVKLDPQAAGSAITYARRYSLAAMVGISQADDDGEGAMGRGDAKPKPQAEAKPKPKPKDVELLKSAHGQITKIDKFFELVKRKNANIDNICRYFHVERPDELSEEDLERCIKQLEAKPDAEVTDAKNKSK